MLSHEQMLSTSIPLWQLRSAPATMGKNANYLHTVFPFSSSANDFDWPDQLDNTLLEVFLLA